MRAVNQPSKYQRVEGEFSIVQSIQLGFSLSLGSVISNEADKSTMRSAEWTITASQAVLHLAQMKLTLLYLSRLPSCLLRLAHGQARRPPCPCLPAILERQRGYPALKQGSVPRDIFQ